MRKISSRLITKRAFTDLAAETARIKKIIMPIFDNDVAPLTYGGDLRTDIVDSDKEIFVRSLTNAVLSNRVDQLTPDAIVRTLLNLPTAKSDGFFGKNITYASIMRADEALMTGDGGKTKSSIINASQQLINKAFEIKKSSEPAINLVTKKSSITSGDFMRKISSRMITKNAGAGIVAIEEASKILSESGMAFSKAEEAFNLARAAGGEVSASIAKAYREAMGSQVAAKKGLAEAKKLILAEIEGAKTADELNEVRVALQDKIPGSDLEEISKIISSKLEEINKIKVPPIVPVVPVAPVVATEVAPVVATEVATEVAPEVAKAGIGKKVSEIFGKAKTYVGNLSPEAKSRALKGILIGAGVVGAGGLTYAAWSNISAGDGADALTAETTRIKEIIMPIFDNDTSPWTIGGDLTTDITDSDKNRFVRNITDAVLSNNTSQLSPEAISSLLVNLPSAKGDGMLGGNITYDSIMKADQSYVTGDGGKTKGSIIDASEQLITIAGEIEKNAAAAEAAEAAEAAKPAPVTPAPVAPTPAPTEPPPISARPAEAGGTTTPISSGIPEMSSILVDLGYLKTPQTSWTPELDTAFRAFMDKGTSLTKDMYRTNLASGKESWPEVASLVGFQPNIAGAAKAVKTLSDSLGPSVASSGATSSDTAAAAGGTDTLPSIVSAMYTGNLTKLLGPDFTRGIDLVNEERRMRILVGALGGASKEGYDNASKVILQQDPGLSADLPKIINGAITKDYVKQNMDLFKRIQTALNRITSGAFGPLAPANMNNAISKMKAWLQTKEGGGWTIQSVTSSQNSQWVKLANERKMKLRLQIAAEMTPAERAAARRIKMREAV
jgi:hypothetical protein